MEFSDRYRQCEQAVRDPVTYQDLDKVARAVVDVQSLLESINKDIARLDKERDALSAARQNLEEAVSGKDGRYVGDLAPMVEESLLSLCLCHFCSQPSRADEDGEGTGVATVSPQELKKQLGGLGPIVRLLREIARQCHDLRQLPLEDNTYFSELERTVELDRDVRQRILTRTTGAV